MVERPDWLARPSLADMERFYPARARRERLGGKVELTCRVRETGDLYACVIKREEPKGQCFGAVSLQMARLMRLRPVTREGYSVAGAKVTFPIIFRIEEDGRPAQPVALTSESSAR